jgi:hypothetical protein
MYLIKTAVEIVVEKNSFSFGYLFCMKFDYKIT